MDKKYKLANRGEGKTSWIIEQAHKDGGSIVVTDVGAKKYTEQIIKERGYTNIPYVFVVDTFKTDSIGKLHIDDVLYVDDADIVLRNLLGHSVKGMALNEDERCPMTEDVNVIINLNHYTDKFIPGDKFIVKRLGESVKKSLGAIRPNDEIMLLKADDDSLTFRHQNHIYDINKCYGYEIWVERAN